MAPSLLGHADIKMTLRYAHLAPEHKTRAVERSYPNKITVFLNKLLRTLFTICLKITRTYYVSKVIPSHKTI